MAEPTTILKVEDITFDRDARHYASELVREAMRGGSNHNEYDVFGVSGCHRVLAAFQGEVCLIGALGYRLSSDDDLIIVERLAVEAQHRRLGAGEALLGKVEQVGRLLGRGSLELTAVNGSKQYYLNRGFLPRFPGPTTARLYRPIAVET